MINTKAVLTSSFHATKHDMQHCNPALGVIKLCNYSLDCWIYGLNDLNTDKTVVTGAGVAKLLPGANSYYDLTLILFTNRMNWIVMSSQKPHTEYDMWYFKGWAETRVTPQKIMIFGIFCGSNVTRIHWVKEKCLMGVWWGRHNGEWELMSVARNIVSYHTRVDNHRPLATLLQLSVILFTNQSRLSSKVHIPCFYLCWYVYCFQTCL